MRVVGVLLAVLLLWACDEKRMGRSPEKPPPPLPIPYQAKYPEPQGTQLKPVKLNAGETQWLPLEAGTRLERWDPAVVELVPGDGGVTLKAVRTGAAVVTGADARGVSVELKVQVFPPLPTQVR